MATPEPPETMLRVREAELRHRLAWYRIEVLGVHVVQARERERDHYDQEVWPDAVVWVRARWWWPRGSGWLLERLLSARGFHVEVVLR